MKLIQRIIKPVFLAGAVFIGFNLNADPISIDSFIQQIDAFINAQNQSLDQKTITELKTFRDALDKGSLTQGALVSFYARLCGSGNMLLIKQVDAIAAPLLANPQSKDEFFAQLRQRKPKKDTDSKGGAQGQQGAQGQRAATRAGKAKAGK